MRELLILSLCLVPLLLGFRASGGDDLEKLAPLDAENCFENSPREVIAQLERTGWFACECCIDQAMSIYADRVRGLVDQRCGKVTTARANLLKSLERFDRAFQVVSSGNWFGHECSRRAAAVEWMLIEMARRSDGIARDVRYEHADLRDVMSMWFRSHRDVDAAHDDEQAFRRHVNEALDALQAAEAGLNPNQVLIMRATVMRRLARWL
jgi:hypothetical protein